MRVYMRVAGPAWKLRYDAGRYGTGFHLRVTPIWLSARSSFLVSERQYSSITNHCRVSLRHILFLAPKWCKYLSARSLFWTWTREFNSTTSHGRVSLRHVLFLAPKWCKYLSARSLFWTSKRQFKSTTSDGRVSLRHVLFLAPTRSTWLSTRSIILTSGRRFNSTTSNGRGYFPSTCHCLIFGAKVKHMALRPLYIRSERQFKFHHYWRSGFPSTRLICGAKVMQISLRPLLIFIIKETI